MRRFRIVVKKAFLAKQALQQHHLKRTKEKLAKLEAQLTQRDASMQGDHREASR